MAITGLKTNGRTKAATVYEVARLAGVSHMTVTRTFSGKQSVADDTRQRVLDAAERLGYRPNMLAKGLRGGRTRTIAAIWQQMGALYSSAIVGEISNRAVAEDYQFSVIDSMGGPEALERTIGDCRVRGVEGFSALYPVQYGQCSFTPGGKTMAEAAGRFSFDRAGGRSARGCRGQ